MHEEMVETEIQSPSPQDAVQQHAPKTAAPVEVSVSATGRRLAFENIKRQLSEADLTNPGTQKLILEMLMTAEADRDECEQYIPKFHEADKRAAILEEKLKTNKVNEVMFGVGVGVGCAIIGLAPTFWNNAAAPSQGPLCLIIGVLLTLGAAIGRIVFK